MARQTVTKRAYWVVILFALLIVGSRFFPSRQPVEHRRRNAKHTVVKQNLSNFLITTPNNARHPLHRVRIQPDDSLKIKGIDLDDHRTTSATPLFLTNLDSLDNQPPIIVSTNEKKDGELVRIDVRSGSDHAIISLVGPTGGDDPAFTRLLQRNDCRLIALTVNYGSPILSIHNVLDPTPTPPTIHRFYESPSESSSHPHQIIVHPHVEDFIYIPDLGTNTIRVVRLLQVQDSGLDRVIDVQELPLDRNKCVGPRHGVFTVDANTLIIACQTSNTIIQLGVARSGYLMPDASLHSYSTLPATTKDPQHHALSAIAMSALGTYLFVANRQVEGAYTRSLKDSIVVYRINTHNLERLGWVDLDCWQPREMLVLDAGARFQRLLVTCVGRGGPKEQAGAGIRLIDVQMTGNEVKGQIVSRWDEDSCWGITSVAV